MYEGTSCHQLQWIPPSPSHLFCWSCSCRCVRYFFILYCTPSSFITLHSYGMHTTYFGILLLHYHYTFSYDASGIHSSFLAYINLLCLACITSVVYLLRLR